MMDYIRIAARIVEARRKKPARIPKVSEEARPDEENMLVPSTEYSCRMEISLSADFEGNAAKRDLIKKLKSEVVASLKLGMQQVAKDMQLRGTGITVSPLKVECAIVDQMDISDEENAGLDSDEIAEPDYTEAKKRKRKR